jgi:hypothetical protein
MTKIIERTGDIEMVAQSIDEYVTMGGNKNE